MKTRIPAIILLWLLIDIYFFSAVATLTVNTSLYLVYWLFDALLAGTIIYSVFTRNTKLISWLMASMLLSFVPKLVSSIVLVLEDFTRLFREYYGATPAMFRQAEGSTAPTKSGAKSRKAVGRMGSPIEQILYGDAFSLAAVDWPQ